MKIKFGTDGWRAIIAQEFTVDNVKRVAEGTALWMKSKGFSKIVIGHDTRFAGRLFAEATAQVMGSHGIKVFLGKGFVSTPMVSLGNVKLGADLGVIITASHNPPAYNGYKLKSNLGGPSVPADISAVEAMIPDNVPSQYLPSIDEMKAKGLLEDVDLEQIYIDHVEANFDLALMKNSGLKFAYDAMYGAGQNVIKRLFPEATKFHCEVDPSFKGQAPEPIEKNLKEIIAYLKSHDGYAFGLINDGDADRIGMFDGKGNFVDSHHLLLLLTYYMVEYKKYTGQIVVSFSATGKLKKIAELYGLGYKVTPIGFKYIAEIMATEDVVVGGEESGGLSVKGHIPERDGIWMGLLVMEFMAKTGKSLPQLIQDVYDKVGTFYFQRDDLHLAEELKLRIVENCKKGEYKAFGPYNIVRTDDLDGFKYYFNDNEWVMIRASGTEPLLRIYSEAKTKENCRSILDAVQATLLKA